MGLYEKLKDAVALNSDSQATLEMYWHWARQFHRFNGKRASEWTGEDVQRFMVHVHADAARGVSPLDGVVRTVFPTVNFLAA